MSGILLVLLIFVVVGGALGGVAYMTYQRKLRRAKAIERGLKMVPILIHLPPPSSDTQSGNRDVREVMREKTAQAEVLYDLIAGTATEGFGSKFYGQRHVALELVAVNGVVHFFAAVPVALVSVIKKAIQTAYPGARMEEVEDHNIFNQEGRLAATLGGEMVLRADSAYPIATYAKLERDPMEAVLTAISALDKKDGVAVQIMLRPAGPRWSKHSIRVATSRRKGRSGSLGFSAADVAKAALKAPSQEREEERARMGSAPELSNLQLSEIESIEEKTKHPGFEVLVRVIVSTESVARSQQLLRDIATAFALFETPGLNGFKFLPALDVQGLVTAFIFRFFPPELKSNVLNSVELATLFHLPDAQFTPSASVERQQSKQVDGPVQLPAVGLLFGVNEFRGVKKEIRLSAEDRRRHTYILGQTGTGKSTMLENLAVQDMLAGNGFAFIDPHGDSAEKLLAMIPKNRAEDVIYFNPGDMEYPVGLNLFEFTDPTQKDFIVQETINMLYKLYDPGHTGIIGPRYEHWYRNAALTLMADPGGATFIEIPKVFTDTDYLKKKFKYLRDPTVIDFWTKEMGQTSDYHKSEMLGWFVSKFGAFQNNEMMRNIIGQTKSSFQIRDVMDQKKILIVNLSKGRIGELNSQLLGMIFVIKFQAAAMSRADVPEDQRSDFCLYVDEFQNFSTDSFASILSEARKYRLNLIVANQFIGQLKPEIRDAVFGNIGTIVAHRMGPEDAEFMVKQFAPVFDASDLVNIPNYNAAMRLMIGGLPSQPFSIRDSAPLGKPNLELGLAVRQLSAAKYGHARAAVEADIIDRMSGGVVGGGAPSAPGGGSLPDGGASPAVPAPVVPVPMPAASNVAAAQPAQAAATAAPLPVAQAPVGVPAPEAQPAAVSLAATPPPIGAPPVDLSAPPAADLPQVVNTAGQAMQPVPGIIPEPNAAAEADRMVAAGGFQTLGAPLPSMATTPPPIGAPPIGVTPPSAANAGGVSAPPVPVFAPPTTGSAGPSSVAAAPESAPAAAAAQFFAPPPIGAPPVDLPGEAAPTEPVAQAAAPPKPSAPDSLSLSDITGGKLPARRAADPAQVPVLSPGAVPSAALGTGEPLQGDPYADVQILGQASSADSVPVQEAPAPPPTGEPLQGDPYAGIDVLAAAPSLAAPDMTAVEPTVASEASSAAAPVQQQPSQTLPSPEPVRDVGPNLAASAPADLSPIAEPPAFQPPVPVPERPISAAQAVQPVSVASQESGMAEPRTILPPEPAPNETVSFEGYRPEPAVPAAQGSSLPSEPLIHFVDPAAEAVLSRPDVPDAVLADQDNVSLAGLPEGVQITPPAPAPAPVPTSAAVAPVVAPATTPDSVVSSPPTSSAAVQDGARPVELSNMVVPPPPIGAPPIEPPKTVPSLEAAPASVLPPRDSGASAEPAPPTATANAALAEAIQASPVTPSAVPTPIQASAQNEPTPAEADAQPAAGAATEQLESVADILKEHHVPVAMPEESPGLAQTPPEQPGEPGPPAVSPAPAEAPSLPSEESPTALVATPEPPSKAAPPPVMPPSSPSVPETVSEPAELKPNSSEPEPPSEVLAPSRPPVTQPAAVASTPASQIEKAEHQIDEVLSASLIRSDATAGHHRLPEPPPAPVSDDESGVDLELNNGGRPRSAEGAQSNSDKRAAEHHGLKVIQPLEPIVPPREQLARELAELNQAEPSAPKPPANTAGSSTAQPAHSDRTSALKEASPPKPPAPSAPKEAAAPATIMKHSGEMLPSAPEPALVGVTPAEPELELPAAESLAAADVAAAKAERTAQAVAVEPTAGPHNAAPAAPSGLSSAPGQQRSPEKALTAPEQGQPAASDDQRSAGRRRRRRGRGQTPEKPAERIETAEEAEHNKPTEAEREQAPLTGKLILPTGERPAPEPVQPKLERPKKLAPGEVFVDENGNVMIGE